MNDQVGDPILLPSKKFFFIWVGGGGGLLPRKKDRFSKALGVPFFELLFFFLTCTSAGAVNS